MSKIVVLPVETEVPVLTAIDFRDVLWKFTDGTIVHMRNMSDSKLIHAYMQVICKIGNELLQVWPIPIWEELRSTARQFSSAWYTKHNKPEEITLLQTYIEDLQPRKNQKMSIIMFWIWMVTMLYDNIIDRNLTPPNINQIMYTPAMKYSKQPIDKNGTNQFHMGLPKELW